MILYKTKWVNNLKIEEIDKEDYELFINFINSFGGTFYNSGNLCKVVLDDKNYIVSLIEDGVLIVEKDGELLIPYYISFDDNEKTFINKDYCYETIVGESARGVRRINNLNYNQDVLIFIPSRENFPRSFLEYNQYIDEESMFLIRSYDVTMRNNNLKSSLNFSYFHTPDDLQFYILKNIFNVYYKKKYFYTKDIYADDNNYLQKKFIIGDIGFGVRRERINCDRLVEEFEEIGFDKQIPKDLSSFFLDENVEYKKLSLIRNSYNNFIKGH